MPGFAEKKKKDPAWSFWRILTYRKIGRDGRYSDYVRDRYDFGAGSLRQQQQVSSNNTANNNNGNNNGLQQWELIKPMVKQKAEWYTELITIFYYYYFLFFFFLPPTIPSRFFFYRHNRRRRRRLFEPSSLIPLLNNARLERAPPHNATKD